MLRGTQAGGAAGAGALHRLGALQSENWSDQARLLMHILRRGYRHEIHMATHFDVNPNTDRPTRLALGGWCFRIVIILALHGRATRAQLTALASAGRGSTPLRHAIGWLVNHSWIEVNTEAHPAEMLHLTASAHGILAGTNQSGAPTGELRPSTNGTAQQAADFTTYPARLPAGTARKKARPPPGP